jgi:dihydroorotase
LIKTAKARGIHVTAEVTPHHLRLTDEALLYGTPGSTLPAYDTNARVNPPLRGDRDRDACVRGLADGTIDCIATDHAPHAAVDKQCEFDRAAPGISGLETALGLVLELVHGGTLTLERVIEALTIAPVRALDLDRLVPGLGSLAPGAPGDAVLFDPNEEWTVDPAAFVSQGRNTPLTGRRLRGRVQAAVVDGRLGFVADERLATIGRAV